MKKRFISITLCGLLLLSGCGTSPIGSNSAEEELISTVIEDIQASMEKLDESYAIYQEAINDGNSFLNDELSRAEFQDHLRQYKDLLSNISFPTESDELKQETLQSDLFQESLTAGDAASDICSTMIKNCEKMGDLLANRKESDEIFDKYDSFSLLTFFDENCRAYMNLYWYSMNEYLLDVPDQNNIQTLVNNLKKLSAFENLNGSWMTDETQLSAAEELCWKQLEANREEYGTLIGDTNLSLEELEREMEELFNQQVTWMMDMYGMDEETAKKLLKLKYEKQELDTLKEELRDKFAPSAENNSTELLNKAAKFAGSHMYEDAYECIDVFMNKEEDSECTYICGTSARAFYRIVEEGAEYTHGILVTLLASDADPGYYQAGDIIVKINDTVIDSAENYVRTSAEKGKVDEILVLRLNGDQIIETVKLSVPTDANLPFSCIIL